MPNVPENRTKSISVAITRAFRTSAAVSCGLSAGLMVTMVEAWGIPTWIVPPLLAGLGVTVLYRVIVRVTRISKWLSTLLSLVWYSAAVVLATWVYTRGVDGAPWTYPWNSLGLLSVYLGYTLADYVIGSDPDTRAFDGVRDAWAGTKKTLAASIPVADALAFGLAVLLTVWINVPTPRLDWQGGLVAASIIVTMSIGWFSVFAPNPDGRSPT